MTRLKRKGLAELKEEAMLVGATDFKARMWGNSLHNCGLHLPLLL